jgi:DHA1 family multidrug resistance protein-like MFS transporter
MEHPARISTGAASRLWWRNAAGMTTVVFIAFFGFNFVIPLLPLFAQLLGVTGIGQTALLGGVLFAIAPLLSAFSSPVWGVVADRFGRKRMVQRALAVSVGAYTLMAMATSIWHVVALRAVIGIFGGFYSMSLAYLMAVTPSSKASIAIGLLQGAQIGGTIAGPAIAGYVADAYGLRASFYAGAVVVAIGFMLLVVLAEDDRAIGARVDAPAVRLRADDDLADVSGALRRAWRGAAGGLSDLGVVINLPGFLPILGALLLTQMVDRSYGPILPLYVKELGAPDNEVASLSGLIVSLGAAAMGLSAGASGLVASRWRPDWLLIASLVAGVTLCAPMALVQTPTQFLVVRVLLGLFAGGTVTLVMSLANTRIPTGSKGAAFGVISSANLLGTAVSPLVTGALAGIDLRLVFVLNSVLYLVALVGVARQVVMRPVPSPPTEAHTPLVSAVPIGSSGR